MLKQETWCSAILSLLIFYFLYCDYQLYKTIQNESSNNIIVTVKAVMVDHVNAYIIQPLTEGLVEITKFPVYFPFITANHISYLGVVFALIGARLVISDNIQVRRLAVIAFLCRQYMDELDGHVARYRLGIDTKKQVSIHNSSGYFVDGICDTIGTIAFWYGAFWFAYNRRVQNKLNVLNLNITYKPLENDQPVNPNPKIRRHICKFYVLLLAQIGLSSLFWNLFLIQYHQTLDPSVADGFKYRTPLQEEIFKSSLMFMIMWLWRCLNPHALCNYFLLSLWLDKADHYAKLSSRYCFYFIISLSFLCLVHLTDIKYRLAQTWFQQPT